jgi:ATP-dependent protease ClpP protease subunit
MRKLLAQEHSKIISKIRAKDPELANKMAAFNLDWFRVKNAASDDEADIYIYDEIIPQWMAEWFGGVSAEGLIAQLNEISAKTINVRINSPGGAVFEAIAIYNALMAHSATINVYVDSLAASAASLISMAGDKVTMMVGSQMMIHDVMGMEMGNAGDMRAFATFLDKQSDNIASIYAEKSGGNIEDFRALMLAETWMYAQEAVDLGLADEIYKRSSNKMPPEEDPDKESEPDPEDPDEEKDDPEEEPPENLLGRKHSLAARGFKYTGRKRAPAPLQDRLESDLDEIMASIGRK